MNKSLQDAEGRGQRWAREVTSQCGSLYFLEVALCIGRYSEYATNETSTYALVAQETKWPNHRITVNYGT